MQQSVSLFDARPFFEKALAHGVQHGIIDQAKLDAICQDAPKGMVQIARYFGTEFLRPELEKAKDRMVNLVSLYLEQSSSGDLRQAAESLRDNSFLSRSKGGSDMLKALIAMPQNSHFGMNEGTGFTDDHIPLLAKWSLRTLPEYQAELALRQQATLLVNAATWMADTLGLNADELEEAGKDAEAVIRTVLLARFARRTEMPDWGAFEKLIVALRKKYPGAETTPAITLPKDLPAQFTPVVERVLQSLLADLPKVLDTKLPVRKLFDQTPAFMGRYFWLEDAVTEVDHFDRNASAAWNKATGGHGDDGSLLTLFLCVAAGSAPKTVLTEKSAATLVRKIRKSGLKAALANQYISDHAPHHHQSDYAQLWDAFVEDSEATLLSDRDYALNDALALLRRECNIAP
ncbi:MAG: hypothetical protein V4627_20450 [Pseudomonadota bacterium]